MRSRACLCILGILVAGASLALGGEIRVPNPSFETGREKPESWILSGGKGEWMKGEAAHGARAVSVTGDGSDSNEWLSRPIAFKPSTAYRLVFRARNIDGSGGTPVSGPGFCNRDLGGVPHRWKRYESVFFSPSGEKGSTYPIRFGQWQVRGTVAFDDVSLFEVQPAYETAEGIALGEGERLQGNDYSFRAPFHSTSRNHSRPLESHRCGFNTNRWVFEPGSEVLYRHRIGNRKQSGARVSVGLRWHHAGAAVVSASGNGESWMALGTLSRVETRVFELPRDMDGAVVVWIRLSAADKGPASFQVGEYEYSARVDGTPLDLVGRTRFWSVLREAQGATAAVAGLGEGVPGGRNAVKMRVENGSGKTLRVRGEVSVSREDRAISVTAHEVEIPPGEHEVEFPYEIPETGLLELKVALEGDLAFSAFTSLVVAELYRCDFGEALPGSTDLVKLWWASSGWKISRTRPAPSARGASMLIRASRNEAEAAQLVVRPEKGLRGFRPSALPLKGPGGAEIAPGAIDILRVRYVQVTQTTDSTGVVAPWPDPLPPFRAPVDVEAGRNLPLWVRVRVPRDAAPGPYAGTLLLEAEGWKAEVPLRVEVFDFALPDRMTCRTAFGFSPGLVWHYQKVRKPEERRVVLDRYWENFGAHHISPYDPAPLDPIEVSWPASAWEGGARDREQRKSGESGLRVEDASPNSQAAASYGRTIPIPPGGLVLEFWYRTKKAGHDFIVTLGHFDATRSWMWGKNLDLPVRGDGTWQRFRKEVRQSPEGAEYVRLTLWAAPWAEDGSPTGTVWYDDVSLRDAGSGAEFLKGGDFEALKPEDLRPEFSWRRWDEAMTRAVDRFHFNTFRVSIPGLGGGTYHSRREPGLLGFGEDAPEYKAAFGNYCGALEAHLKEKGWIDEAFVYWFDEPLPRDYPFVMNGFRKLKEAAPGIARMLTEQPEKELAGGPNIWCPVTPQYDHDEAEARRKAGDRFWWYVCTGPKAPYCTLFIDHPATELRVWLWQTWKRGIDGVLVWQTNYWTSPAAYPDRENQQNPYADPMGWVSGYDTPAGTKRAWGNGDGRFIYPPEEAASANPPGAVLDGPVDSIRWEMLRDGIEDYEYLAILRRLLEERRQLLTAEEAWKAEEMLKVPASVSESMTSFTVDPRPIEERRLAVARLIESLGR